MNYGSVGKMLPQRPRNGGHTRPRSGLVVQRCQRFAEIPFQIGRHVGHCGLYHCGQHLDQAVDLDVAFDFLGQNESSMVCVVTAMVGQAGRSSNRLVRKDGRASAGYDASPSRNRTAWRLSGPKIRQELSGNMPGLCRLSAGFHAVQHVAYVLACLGGDLWLHSHNHAFQDFDQIGDFRAQFGVVGQSESSMGCVRATMVGQAGRSDNQPARKGGHAPTGQKYASCAPALAVEPTRSPFPNKE